MQQERTQNGSTERPRPEPVGWDYDGLPTPKVDGPAVQDLARNERGRDLIVGDVHGQRPTFERLLDKVGYDPAGGDRLLLLGDLIDRGPDSAGMLEWLQREDVFCIRGNHEQLMLDALDGDEHVEVLWKEHNGGGWARDLDSGTQDAWHAALRPLPMALEIEGVQGKIVMAHAEIPVETPWWALREWLEEGDRDARIRVLWARERVFNNEGDTGVPDAWLTYHGHTPLKNPLRVANMSWIDTAAAYADRYEGAAVSCVIIDPDGTEHPPVQARVLDS